MSQHTDQIDGHLVAIDATNWRSALTVRVSDEQLPMVADLQPIVLVLLAKAYVREGDRDWEVLGYQADDGTFLSVLGLSHFDATAELRNFAVDIDHQNGGVGTRVLDAVAHHLQQRGVDRLMLTVHPENHIAIRCYERAGFVRTGEHRGAEPVFRRVL